LKPQSSTGPAFMFINDSPVEKKAPQKSSKQERKEENFEEIVESKEIIEDRINRQKYAMVEFTLKQQEVKEGVQKLEKDIRLLKEKLDESLKK